MGFRRSSSSTARRALRTQLQKHRYEIEQLTITRVSAISTPTETGDTEYIVGLRAAVASALDYALISIEHGEINPRPIPLILLSQARLAARNSISLDTVLRRYIAGQAVFSDFVVRESRKSGLLRDTDLQAVLRDQATTFDRLIACVSEEHGRETQGIRRDTSHQRRARLVRRLLDGELLDSDELSYELDAHHLGMVASGREATEAIQEMAAALDRRLLLVRQGESQFWAWLGGQRAFDLEEFDRYVATSWPPQACLAVGEPAEDFAGWRLTHRQAAAAALPIVRQHAEPYVRYADVALVVSVLCDELLTTSLRRLYLEPLERGRDGGEALRRTLRAYFIARSNVTSAAAALGVTRQTVTNRLRAIEGHLGRPIEACAQELVMALEVHHFRRTRQK